MKKVLLLLVFVMGVNLLQAQQRDGKGTARENKPGDEKLENLLSRYEYHFFQRRKAFISEAKRREHKEKLDMLEKEIIEVHRQRSKTPVNADSIIRELTSELVTFKEPVYAYEAPAQWVNGSVMFGAKNMSVPFLLTAGKTVNDKISLGIFCGVFSEKAQVVAPDNFSEHSGFVFSEGNYRYTYVAPGIRGSYHFFDIENPLLGLSPKKFNLYVTGLLGYNIMVHKNFLPNSPVEVKDSTKDGINFGLMGGIRYTYDEHIGFFAEAGYSRLGFVSLGASFRWLK